MWDDRNKNQSSQKFELHHSYSLFSEVLNKVTIAQHIAITIDLQAPESSCRCKSPFYP